MTPQPGPVARTYARIRTARWFFFILAGFCGLWVAWNSAPGLPHFDDRGFGRLTLLLSIEASMASQAILMIGAEFNEWQKKTLSTLLHLSEAMHVQLSAQREVLAEVLAASRARQAAAPSDLAGPSAER